MTSRPCNPTRDRAELEQQLARLQREQEDLERLRRELDRILTLKAEREEQGG